MLITSVSEAARYLGWNKRKVKRWIAAGKFPAPIQQSEKPGWGVAEKYTVRVWDSDDLDKFKAS